MGEIHPGCNWIVYKLLDVVGRTPWGYDLWFGTCGWKSLVQSEIGVGVAAGKVGNTFMWCQYDDDAPIKFTRCCEKSYRCSIYWSLIDRSRACRLATAVRWHGLALTSYSGVTSRFSFRRCVEMMRQNVMRHCFAWNDVVGRHFEQLLWMNGGLYQYAINKHLWGQNET